MMPTTFGCQVIRPTDPPEVLPPVYPTSTSSEVSAGEAIPITSNTGTYTTLVQTVRDDSVSYHSEALLAGPFPNGLIADIPGDVFPGFSNVVIPNVAELRLTSPTPEERFSTTTPITWDANSNGNSSMHIVAGFINPTTGESVSASCVAEDDGNFSLSPEIIAELQLGDNYEPVSLGIVRSATSVEINDSSAIFISNGYSEFFSYLDFGIE